MILEILKYPHPILKKIAKEVDKKEINDELREVFSQMKSLMRKAYGVGLAANQVGITKRFFTMVESLEEDNDNILVAINPVILSKDGEVNDQEGCLSFPNVSANVQRAKTVVMKAIDENGNEYQIEREGYLARCIQHEIDHLDGIVYFDRLGPVKRKMIEKKYKKFNP